MTSVYRETVRSITLLTEPQRRVDALVYMIDRGHVQYAGRLDLATQLHLVRQGHGQSGPNRDYVLSTVHALEALGLYDRDLHLLAERLRGAHEEHAQEHDVLLNQHPGYRTPLDPIDAETLGAAGADTVERFLSLIARTMRRHRCMRCPALAAELGVGALFM